MDTAEAAETALEGYLLRGVAKEIFFADEAKALCVEIGGHAGAVNARGFGRLFGSLQAAYSDRQTLCVTKLFDPENGRFPTRSIPAVLALIERHAPLWSLPQRHALEEELAAAGRDAATVRGLDGAALSRAVAAHFRGTLPRGDGADRLSVALRNLREARNKVIAHNEAVEPAARTPATWGDAECLVDYAKGFVTTVSFGFLGLYMGGSGDDGGTYHATADARGSSAALNRLLKVAGLAP